MKLAKLLATCFALLFVLAAPVAAADPFSIRTSLTAQPESQQISVTVEEDSIYEFSVSGLEHRLGIRPGYLEGLTVTALPDTKSGILILDGVELDPYDYITRAEIDRLIFRPGEGVAHAIISFVPRSDQAVSASLHINIVETASQPPEIDNLSFETYKNLSISGFIPVSDPEEEGVVIRVIQAPAKGAVRFSGQNFVYEPFHNATGRDIFTICAIDSVGNLSREAIISIAIENTRSSFSYADMVGNPSHYAAIKLHERGIMSGCRVGDLWLFDPADMMTRGEFLVLALAGARIQTSPTVNTGLPNDAAIPMWLKPYVAAGIKAGMLSPNDAFNYREIPIRAEAVLITARAAAINDVKDFTLTMSDRASIPDWAEHFYKELAAYRMLDLHDGRAHPHGSLTNSYAADLAWQLYKHRHR